ncbi:hypothetical protein [Streptomyces sp. NPDC012508]|uniref:hypothetical protein n=1 Tax=Streptomyces sp. NPDC012508 TaxID=3364837 RepID=UPI003682481F
MHQESLRSFGENAMIGEVRMRTGVPSPFGDIDFILAHVQVREGQPPLASFTVVADEEQNYDLGSVPWITT